MRLHLRRARSQDAPDEGRPSGSLSGCRAGGGTNASTIKAETTRLLEGKPSGLRQVPPQPRSNQKQPGRYLIAPNSISYFLFLDSVRAQFFAQRFVRGDVGIERPRTGGTVPRPLFLRCPFSFPFHTDLPAGWQPLRRGWQYPCKVDNWRGWRYAGCRLI